MTAYRRETILWASLTLGAFALLPWERVGKAFLAWSWSSTGLTLVPTAWPLVAVGLAAALAVFVGTCGRGSRRAGGTLLAVSTLGVLAALYQMATAGRAFGLGGFVSLLGLLTLVGIGLAQAGYVRGGAFVAAAILWTCRPHHHLHPLPAPEHVAGERHHPGTPHNGRLAAIPHLSHFPVCSAILNSPPIPYAGGPALGIVVGAAALVGIRLIFGRWTRALAWGIGLGVAAGLLTMLALGLGALRNSLFLAVSVGLISTGLGFVFALLESRSTLWTRRLLAPFSILPIITPAFVLGLAMIYMFGRRGFVTHTLLGLSTNVFFGPLGVGVAQVLAFTPIAYLVLVGVIHSLDVSLEEAARTLRADRWTLFRTILWPLMRPGLANAILLVMIESLADFGNPLLLGGGVPFLPTEIFYAIEGRFDQHEAAVYGLVLLVITLTIFFLQRYWLGKRSYVTVTGKPSGGRPTPLPLATDLVLTACSCSSRPWRRCSTDPSSSAASSSSGVSITPSHSRTTTT